MIIRFLSRIVCGIWKVFLDGLLTLLPFTLTICLFTFSFKLIKGWLSPLRRLHLPFMTDIPQAEIIVGLGIIFIAGIFLKSFIIRSCIRSVEVIVEHVPLVRHVYSGIKQLIHAFSPDDNDTFKQVVIVEFPLAGTYTFGFQTKPVLKELSPVEDQEFYNVFIPTSPNPTSGFFVMIHKNSIKTVELTTQEAMTLIISGGIIQPDKFKLKK